MYERLYGTALITPPEDLVKIATTAFDITCCFDTGNKFTAKLASGNVYIMGVTTPAKYDKFQRYMTAFQEQDYAGSRYTIMYDYITVN